MAQKEYLIRLARLADVDEPALVDAQGNPLTDQNPLYAYYRVPVGQDVDTSRLYEPHRAGFSRWTGNIANIWGNDCGIVVNPPPQTGALTWNQPVATLAQYVAGNDYKDYIPYSAVTLPAGQSLTSFSLLSAPFYLSMTGEAGVAGVYVRGPVPLGTSGPLTVRIRATQTNGKYADQDFTFTQKIVVSTDIRAIAQISSGQAIMRIGPTSDQPPTIQIISAPAGFSDTGPYSGTGPKKETVNGQDFFYSHVYPLINGMYTVKFIHLTRTVYSQFSYAGGSTTIIFELSDNPPGTAPDYSMSFSAANIGGGGTATVAAFKKQGAQYVSVPGSTYRATNAMPGTTIVSIADDSARISVAENSPGYQLIVEAVLAGVVIATDTIPIVDTTPYIVSILHQYNPSNQTDYFLLKYSNQTLSPSDTAKVPVWRCKRAEEATWRGSFISMYDAAGQFTQYNQGYRLYMQANLSAAGVSQTSGVFQFKPYPAAPDSSIITLTVSHDNNSAPDFGTEVYNVDGGSAPPDPNDRSSLKFKGIYQV